MVKGSRINPVSIFKGIYHNDFQWMFIKSLGMFLIGVRLAKEFVGVEIMPALTSA